MRKSIAVGALRKIAIVSGLCLYNDAISASVHDDALALSDAFGFHTRVFTHRNEFPDIEATEARDSSQIIFDSYFQACDLIIYHFGIYFELFNTILLGNGHAPQVVRYHNLTPRHLLPPSEWAKFESSAAQLYNFAAADAVWPVSDFNREDLRGLEIVPQKLVEPLPLSVGDGNRRKGFAGKEPGPIIRLLFVGRMVRAKGLRDLLSAATLIRQACLAFSLRIVGDPQFSHLDYVGELREFANMNGIADAVTFVGRVSNEELDAEYDRAHILVLPSYHEGFCKPVIEALRFGCVPVTYTSGNLPFVARGLSRTVSPGDVVALARAIAEVARSVQSAPAGRRIPVDRGSIPLRRYEAAVDELLAGYGFPAVSQRLREAAQALIARCKPGSLGVNRWSEMLQAAVSRGREP